MLNDGKNALNVIRLNFFFDVCDSSKTCPYSVALYALFMRQKHISFSRLLALSMRMTYAIHRSSFHLILLKCIEELNQMFCSRKVCTRCLVHSSVYRCQGVCVCVLYLAIVTQPVTLAEKQTTDDEGHSFIFSWTHVRIPLNGKWKKLLFICKEREHW